MKYHYGFPQDVWDNVSVCLRDSPTKLSLICREIADLKQLHWYDEVYENGHLPFFAYVLYG